MDGFSFADMNCTSLFSTRAGNELSVSSRIRKYRLLRVTR